MDLVLRTTLEYFSYGATSGHPGWGRPAELTEWLGTRSRKDTELPHHLFLPVSLVAKGLSPQCNVFSPQAIFHWVVMQRPQRGRSRKKQKKQKEEPKRHDLLGPASIAKFGSHFSPTEGAFSLSKQGQDRSRKREWVQEHHSSVGTVVCSTPSPLVPMRDRVTGSTSQVREQRCGSLAGQEASGRWASEAPQLVACSPGQWQWVMAPAASRA